MRPKEKDFETNVRNLRIMLIFILDIHVVMLLRRAPSLEYKYK